MIKNFCRFPWTQLIVNTATNQWRWCPIVEQQSDFLQEYPLNNKELTSVRDAINNDQRHNACKGCWSEEDLGFRSFRQSRGGDNAYGVGHGVRSLTVDIGSLDNKETFSKLVELITTNISYIKLINIRARGFTNSSDLFNLIDTLLNSQKVSQKPELRILTNGYYEYELEQSLTALRKNGWHTSVIFQLEAIAENLDFLRQSVQWETVRPNFRKLVIAQHCKEIEVTVNALNLHMLSDIPAWLNKIDMIDIIKPTINIETGIVSLTNLGELGLYLAPGLSKWKEHPNWTEAANKVNKIIRKQRFVKPKHETLLALIDKIKADAIATNMTVPLRIKKIAYLADISQRQLSLMHTAKDEENDLETQADLG